MSKALESQRGWFTGWWLVALFTGACSFGSSDSATGGKGNTPGNPAATYKSVLRFSYGTGGFDAAHVYFNYPTDYAYLSLNNAQVDLLSIANPVQPVYAGTIFQAGESTRTTVLNSHLYSLAGSSHRVYISNVTSAPSYTAVASLLHNNTANVYPLAMVSKGTYALIGTGNDPVNSSLTIWNVTTPSAATGVSVFATTQPVYQLALDSAQNYAYLAEGSNGLHVVSVASLAAPAHVTNLTGLGNVTSVISCQAGGYLCVGSDTGFHVVSIGTATSPQLIKSIATAPVVDLSTDVLNGMQRLFVSLGANGFEVYDITFGKIQFPLKISNYADGSIIKSITTINGYTYASAGVTGIKVFELVAQ